MERHKNIIGSSIVTLFIISASICIGINFLINAKLTWSLSSLSGIILALALILPLIYCNNHRIVKSIIALGVTIVPCLLLIEYGISFKGWVFPLAAPISVVSIIFLLIISSLILYTHINKFYLISIFLIFIMLLNILINILISSFLETKLNILNLISSLTVCIILFFVSIFLAINKTHNKNN